MGLARHCKFNHNLSLLEYMVKYDNLKIPKCVCGKNVKHKDGLKFNSTCGNEKCIKVVLRNKRLKFMKEHPEQTAWRLKNMSYPEKLFKKTIELLNYDKQFYIEREYSVFPYFIDFAFINEMVAVEIDGQQHELPDRKANDIKKDDLLVKRGWRVFRITSKQMISNPKGVVEEVITFIGESKSNGNCGIVTHKPKQYKHLMINGEPTDKQQQNYLKQRKVDRPPYEELVSEINELGYVGTGKKYGVSDNSIRKWVKYYEKYG